MREASNIEVHVVRSYELDSYGHVNNAVYAQWIEHGRGAWLKERGFTYASLEAEAGVRFVTRSIDLAYERGLYEDDALEIRTRLERWGRRSLRLVQEVWRVGGPRPLPDGEEELAARAEVGIVITDPQMKGSVPVPEALRQGRERPA